MKLHFLPMIDTGYLHGPFESYYIVQGCHLHQTSHDFVQHTERHVLTIPLAV